MSEIRIRVGSEVVQLCDPGDRPFPVDLVEREIAQSRARQAVGAGRFVERDRRPRDAVRWTGDNWDAVEEWLGVRVSGPVTRTGDQVIASHQGRHVGVVTGDWFVYDPVTGQLHKLLDGEFRQTYEPESLVAAPPRQPGGELWDDEMRSALATARDLKIAPPPSPHRQVRPGRKVPPAELAAESLRVALGDAMAELTKWGQWASAICSVDLPNDLVRGGDKLRTQIGVTLELAASANVPAANLVAPTVPVASRDVGLSMFENLKTDHLTWRIEKVPSTWTPRPSAPGIDEVVIEACARVAYDVYRVAFVGDDPMPDFDALDPGRRLHVLRAARAAVSGTTPEAFHAEWTSELARDGWVAGPELSEDAKTHPNLVPYGDLPDEQHLLDELFFAAATATFCELGRIEASSRIPILKIDRDVTPEQFAAFKREWTQQVSTSSWKAPIVDVGSAQFISHAPLLKFVDDRIDSMLRRPDAWGPPIAVELQVLAMLEVRAVALGERSADCLVTQAFHDFVRSRFGDAATVEPLSEQLARLGRIDEFPVVMGEFVAARRRSSW